jgi:hypothetical protein
MNVSCAHGYCCDVVIVYHRKGHQPQGRNTPYQDVSWRLQVAPSLFGERFSAWVLVDGTLSLGENLMGGDYFHCHCICERTGLGLAVGNAGRRRAIDRPVYSFL